VLTDYGLSDSETMSNTSDAGSNMKAALGREDASWHRCAAHNIANACDDALGKRTKKDPTTRADVSTHPAAADFVGRLRKVVAYFKRGQRMESLKDEQQELYNKILTLHSDHFIRWNSTEKMCQRLLLVREAIQQYHAK
jgi:hypothetical protein